MGMTSDPRRAFQSHLPADLPRDGLPEAGMRGDAAYELLHSHLLLDGNARLNLATFVGTWAEPEAQQLMRDCANKNLIDKDEYPQTADLEQRCLRLLAHLWRAPDPADAVGASTTGSSEGCMLAGLVMRWHWRRRRGLEGADSSRPNIVMGANRQVCWDKFCVFFDVEPRFMPLAPGRLHLTAEQALDLCDARTIGVVAVLGSVVDGSYEPIAEIAAALDEREARTGLAIPLHVDAASGGFVAPFNSPQLQWDFQLPRVQSINASGHKYGGVLPGVGWVLWRSDALLPRELRFDVNDLGGVTSTIGMNFSRPGAQVVVQYFNFLHLGRRGYANRMAALEAIACHLADGLAALAGLKLVSHPKGQLPAFCVELDPAIQGWTVFHLSDKLQERGWLVPAYNLPDGQTERAVLRFVVRAGFSRHLAEELLADVARAVAWFGALEGAMPVGPAEATGFHH